MLVSVLDLQLTNPAASSFHRPSLTPIHRLIVDGSITASFQASASKLPDSMSDFAVSSFSSSVECSVHDFPLKLELVASRLRGTSTSRLEKVPRVVGQSQQPIKSPSMASAKNKPTKRQDHHRRNGCDRNFETISGSSKIAEVEPLQKKFEHCPFICCFSHSSYLFH